MEYLYRKVDIENKGELFWQVFAKGILSDYLDSLLTVNDEISLPVCFPICYLPIYSTRYYWIKGSYNRVWHRYMTAATNFPFLKIFPSFLKGRFAIDGGAVDNIPLYPLLRFDGGPTGEKPDVIFVLHFDAQYDYRRIYKTDVPIIDLDLSICNGFKKNHFDFSQSVIDERITAAREYGRRIAQRVFDGDNSRERLQRVADEIFMEEHTLRQQNPSVDKLVSYLNVIGRAFRIDSIATNILY